jgi:hypothetical protein
VEDTKVYPVRGQTIIVYAPNVKECITVVPAGETTFYLSRWLEFIKCDIRWEGNILDTTGLDPWDGTTWGHF